MTLERKLASALSMDDAAWLRHANPWSRVWLNRDVIPVPDHHRIVPHVPNGVTAIGAVFVAWGLIELAVWPTLLGSVLVYCGKLWFLDRMVWLYEDMVEQHDQYRAWLD